MCYVVSAAYLHALSWESLTLCKPGCCLLTVFCHFPGLELLKNWCVKGYHTGAGMDLAQMVRITVGKVGRDGCLLFTCTELGRDPACSASSGSCLTCLPSSLFAKASRSLGKTRAALFPTNMKP